MTVLIVDDEELLRLMAEALVEDLGHQPLTACSPAAALACADGEPIDILFTDLNMAGDPDAGIKLAAVLRRAQPGLAVIYTSGSGLTPAEQARFVPEAVSLPKPYTLPQLAVAMDQATARAAALSASRRMADQTAAMSDASVASAPMDTRTIQRPSITAGVR